MKMTLHNQGRQRGSAVVIVLVLLSVMAALVVGNMTNLRRLGTELKLLERKQTQRLQTSHPPREAVPRPAATSRSTE
jgi:hypothetical protein